MHRPKVAATSASAQLEMVGRDAELRRLVALLDEVRTGSGHTAVVEGEPGIGKSRLVEALLADPATSGMTVLGATAEMIKSDRPYGAVSDALTSHGGRSHQDSSFEELVDDVPDPAVAPAGRRHRILDAIEDLVERECLARPTLLVLEDVQWADTDSIVALHALSRRSDLALFLLLTCRGAPRTDELQRLLDELADRGADRIILSPLGEETVLGLAKALLGAQPGPHLRRRLNRAAGNPLFVLELLAGLDQEGLINLDHGTAETTLAEGAPPSLRALILRRLGFLGQDTVNLLRMAAVVGESFTASDLELISGRPLPAIVDALASSLAAGFISAADGGYAFRHDLVQGALYTDLDLGARRALHLHLARALDQAGAPLNRVAAHAALGAEPGDRQAVSWLAGAAQQVATRGSSVACDLLARAAELLPETDPERVELEMERIRVLSSSGRTREAEDLADRLEPLLVGTPAHLQLDLIRLSLMYIQLRFDEIGALAARLLADPALPPAARAEIKLRSVGQLLMRGDFKAIFDTYDEVLQLVGGAPLVRLTGFRGFVVRWWAEGHWTRALADSRKALAIEESLQSIDSFAHVSVRAVAGASLAAVDDFRGAEATLERCRAELERSGLVQQLVEYHCCRGFLHLAQGRWDDALAEYATSIDVGRTTGAVGFRGVLSDPTPLLQLFQGDLSRAQGSCTSLLRSPAARLIRGFWTEPTKAIISYAAGDQAVAAETLRSWFRMTAELGVVPDLRTQGRSIAEISLKSGDDELQVLTVEAAREVCRRADGVRSADASGLLVEGMMRDDMELLMAAVEGARAGGRPFDMAEALAETGLALLRVGDREQGRPHVMEALEIFDSVGARRQGHQLALAMRELGIRRGSREKRRAATSGWGALTDSELRVAALVEEGLTNADIGSRLFISRGTVATHLRSIFRKLDISSRAALAREVARQTA